MIRYVAEVMNRLDRVLQVERLPPRYIVDMCYLCVKHELSPAEAAVAIFEHLAGRIVTER